jgi:hypothetical protein
MDAWIASKRATSAAYDYADWFMPPRDHEQHPTVTAAMAYADDSAVESHDFWRLADESRDVLSAWVTQELVVTGAFAQCVLRLGSTINNVHLRAMFMVVAEGEHGRVREGVATRSHPWLLHRLADSMAIRPHDVQPLDETIDFLEYLTDAVSDPIVGLAVIGVGNERLILPEYGAAKQSFAKCWPDSKYLDFLDANIHEDVHHSQLLADVASALIAEGEDPDKYYAAAVASVDQRVTYYDRLRLRFTAD